MTVFDRPMLDPSWNPCEPFWGHVEELTRNALPHGQRGRITVPARHFFSGTLLLPGTGVAPWTGLCWWGYVGPSGVYVGATFAHLGAMLPVGPCCGRCWTVWYPPEVILGYDFTFTQNFAWKSSPSGLRGAHSILATPFPSKSWILSAWRLPPVACEVPGNASRGVGGTGPPLAKLDLLQRRRSRNSWRFASTAAHTAFF